LASRERSYNDRSQLILTRNLCEALPEDIPGLRPEPCRGTEQVQGVERLVPPEQTGERDRIRATERPCLSDLLVGQFSGLASDYGEPPTWIEGASRPTQVAVCDDQGAEIEHLRV